MTALLTTALFVAAGLLGAGTLVHAWNAYRHRFAQLGAQLREVERGVAVRYARQDQARPAAAVHRLRFTQRADRLPCRPALPVPVAA